MSRWHLCLYLDTLNFLQVLYILLGLFNDGPHKVSMAFKVILRTLQKFEVIHLCAKVSNIYVCILLSFSHNFCYFSQVYKWPLQHCPWLSKWTWKHSKHLKLVISVPTQPISTFGSLGVSLTLFYFSEIDPRNTLQGFEINFKDFRKIQDQLFWLQRAMKWILKAFAVTLKNLQKIPICVLTAKYT